MKIIYLILVLIIALSKYTIESLSESKEEILRLEEEIRKMTGEEEGPYYEVISSEKEQEQEQLGEEEMPIPPEVESLKDFENWLKSHKLSKLTSIGLRKPVNRTLLTKIDINIKDGSELALILVPIDLSLTVSNVLSIPLLGDALNISIESKGEIYTDIELLSIGLLWHKYFLGKESSIYEWILSLPTSYPENFIYYDQSLLEFAFKISGIELSQKIENQQSAFHSSWEKVQLYLFKRYKHLFPSSSYNILNWKWAVCTVLSRSLTEKAVTSTTGTILVPYFDFINHSPRACYPTEDFAMVGLLNKDNKLQVAYYTNVSRKHGDELFRCYGKISNSQSLTNYGFVIQDNPYNYLPITFEWTSDRKYLEPFKEKYGNRVMEKLYHFDPVLPKVLLDVFRLDRMTEKEYKRELFKHIDEVDDVPLSVYNEYKALTDIYESLNELREKYFNKRTLEKDHHDLLGLGLKNVPTGAKREMLLYVSEQKRLINHALYQRVVKSWMSLLIRRNEPNRSHLGILY